VLKPAFAAAMARDLIVDRIVVAHVPTIINKITTNTVEMHLFVFTHENYNFQLRSPG
jgi:hypothetical protein